MSPAEGSALWDAIRPLYAGRPKPYWLVALSAYIDDSRENWNGWSFHAIAGYLGTTAMWERGFSPRWKRLIESAPKKIEEYKASDVRRAGKKGSVFEAWGPAEAEAYSRRAIEELIDSRYRMFGVGAVIVTPTEEDKEQAAQWEKGALGLALIHVLNHMCRFAQTGGGRPDDDVHFVCDCQNELEGRLHDLWNEARALVQPNYNGNLSRLQFEDSKKLMPLQAADILAYETRKDLKSRFDRRDFPMSMALRRMLDAYPTVGLMLDPRALTELVDASRDRDPDRYSGPSLFFVSSNLTLGGRAFLRRMPDNRPNGPVLPPRPSAPE